MPQDFRFALRQFRHSPGFTLTAVLTLALGIGATTAIFSLVDGILLRPLAFPEPERLVAIHTLEFPPGVAATNLAAANPLGASYPDFLEWRQRNRTFDSVASCDSSPRLFSKPNGEGSRVLSAARVSANLFSTLGVAPALGRTFKAEEELPGHRAVILSHELWASDFASSPNALGRMIKISDVPHTIIGVMPAGFHFPVGDPSHFWNTFAGYAEGPYPRVARRDDDGLYIVGRLKSGIKIQQAVTDLSALQRGMAQQYSEDRNKLAVSMTPLLEDTVGDFRPALSLLLAAVAVVLLIGCANVAGLLLARANSRRPELAVRTALGASRWQVLSQLLLEALVLALLGGAVGVVLAFVLLRTGLHFVPGDLPRVQEVGLDARVLAFAVLLAGVTALLFGLLPGWRMSSVDPANALRESGQGITGGRDRHRLHSALVIAETALGFTLLIGSGLLIRSMINMLHIEPGFDTQHTLAFDIALTNTRFPDPAKVPFFTKLLPQLAALPGVERASAGDPLPPHWPWDYSTNLNIPGYLASPDNLPNAVATVSEPGYFETLSIPLLRGRTFTEHDNDPKAPAVAVINRSLARRYFPAADPIGQHFVPMFQRPGQADSAREIIGIVGDTRSEDLSNLYSPEFFLPYAQDPGHQRAKVVMKVAGDPLSYENEVRNVVAAVDKDAPVFEYRAFADDIARQTAQPRFEALLVSGFAIIALLLSAVGLYAVLSFVVADRTRELGLRMALGADRSDILRLVLRRGLTLAAIGIGVGLLTSLFATQLVSDLLFDVVRLDRAVFLIVTLTLLLVSMFAALVPALRAAYLDPVRTLRDQ
ncbi:MAG: ABC transporter permease [Terriglobales bacterium]